MVKSSCSAGKKNEKPTYAAGERVVQRKAWVTFTHGAQVGADAAAVSTAALIRILFRTVACFVCHSFVFFLRKQTRMRTTGWFKGTDWKTQR